MSACSNDKRLRRPRPSSHSHASRIHRREWPCRHRTRTLFLTVHPVLSLRLSRASGDTHKAPRQSQTLPHKSTLQGHLNSHSTRNSRNYKLRELSLRPRVGRRSGLRVASMLWPRVNAKSSSSMPTFTTRPASRTSGSASSASTRASLGTRPRLSFASTRSRIARSGNDWRRRSDCSRRPR